MLCRYIRHIIEESRQKKKKTSAGVVILKNIDSEWKVLVLKDVKGRFDITKGLVEPGESYLSAAIREASEEAGIFLNREDFLWGLKSLSYGKGRAFIAATDQEPFILPNPETKEFEHESWDWLSFKEAKDIVIDYLKPSIEWAEDIVSHHKKERI